MLTVYGIPNCDTVKKTRTWLEKHNIEYTFHNYKTEGISNDRIKVWFKTLLWEKVVNKGSTTWKGLSEEEKALITDEKSAAKLMMAHNSVIKRPLIEDPSGKAVAIGFSEKEYEERFLKIQA